MSEKYKVKCFCGYDITKGQNTVKIKIFIVYLTMKTLLDKFYIDVDYAFYIYTKECIIILEVWQNPVNPNEYRCNIYDRELWEQSQEAIDNCLKEMNTVKHNIPLPFIYNKFLLLWSKRTEWICS